MKKIFLRIFLVLSILFAVLSLFFFLKIQERNYYLDDLIKTTLHGGKHKTREEVVRAISNEIYRYTNKALDANSLGLYERLESISIFNMTSAVSLKYGGFGIMGHTTLGPCGTMSRILLNALWRLNMPARKLQLLSNIKNKIDSHTMVEFFDNGRWQVISPSNNSFIWKNKNGEIATVEEIKKDKDIFSQIFKQEPNFTYLFQGSKNIRWNKLPKSIVRIIRFTIGDKAFNKAETPKLYDIPRTLFFIICLIAICFFGTLFLVLKFKPNITKK